jgi:hypothetical protein
MIRRNFSTGFWVAFQLGSWVLAEPVLLPLAMPLFTRRGRKPRHEEFRGSGTPL